MVAAPSRGARPWRLGTALLLLLQLAQLAPAAWAAPAPTTSRFNITMPRDAVTTDEKDAYICTTLALPAKAQKLVGVEPLARQEVVHHILLFGEQPALGDDMTPSFHLAQRGLLRCSGGGGAAPRRAAVASAHRCPLTAAPAANTRPPYRLRHAAAAADRR